MESNGDKQIIHLNPKNSSIFSEFITTNKIKRPYERGPETDFEHLIIDLVVMEKMGEDNTYDSACAKITHQLSKHGRLLLTRCCDLIDDFEVSLFPGEQFNVTLFMKVCVPKDFQLRREYIWGNAANVDFSYHIGKTEWYIPIKKLVNPPAKFRFFDDSMHIAGLKHASMSLEFEFSHSHGIDLTAFSSKRCVSIRSHFVLDRAKNGMLPDGNGAPDIPLMLRNALKVD